MRNWKTPFTVLPLKDPGNDTQGETSNVRITDQAVLEGNPCPGLFKRTEYCAVPR